MRELYQYFDFQPDQNILMVDASYVLYEYLNDRLHGYSHIATKGRRLLYFFIFINFSLLFIQPDNLRIYDRILNITIITILIYFYIILPRYKKIPTEFVFKAEPHKISYIILLGIQLFIYGYASHVDIVLLFANTLFLFVLCSMLFHRNYYEEQLLFHTFLLIIVLLFEQLFMMFFHNITYSNYTCWYAILLILLLQIRLVKYKVFIPLAFIKKQVNIVYFYVIGIITILIFISNAFTIYRP